MWHRHGGFKPIMSAGGRAYKIRIKCNLKKPSTVSDQIYSDSHPRYSHKYIIMDWILRVLLSGVSLCARHPTLSHPLGFRSKKVCYLLPITALYKNRKEDSEIPVSREFIKRWVSCSNSKSYNDSQIIFMAYNVRIRLY